MATIKVSLFFLMVFLSFNLYLFYYVALPNYLQCSAWLQTWAVFSRSWVHQYT